MQKKSEIDIFWTGGMDSTFRIIQSLTTTESYVQPHYIVRYEDSTGIEIDTMIQIRRAVIARFPEVSSRFLPTIYMNEGHIPKCEDIGKYMEELSKLGHTREQYQIMANYCKANKIESIDVSLIKYSGEIGESEFLQRFLYSPAFSSFKYPLIEMSKKDLLSFAKNNNWDDILVMTSFCRRPIKKISPCGLCGPCSDALDSGMGFRFPFMSRIKANLQTPFRRYWRKNYLKHDRKFFKFINKLFMGKF